MRTLISVLLSQHRCDFYFNKKFWERIPVYHRVKHSHAHITPAHPPHTHRCTPMCRKRHRFGFLCVCPGKIQNSDGYFFISLVCARGCRRRRTWDENAPVLTMRRIGTVCTIGGTNFPDNETTIMVAPHSDRNTERTTATMRSKYLKARNRMPPRGMNRGTSFLKFI